MSRKKISGLLFLFAIICSVLALILSDNFGVIKSLLTVCAAICVLVSIVLIATTFGNTGGSFNKETQKKINKAKEEVGYFGKEKN